MSNGQPVPRKNLPQNTRTPLPENNTAPRVYVEYDIPEELFVDANTPTFGAIRTIGLKMLTPLEEKTGVARARGDALRLAYELSEVSIGFVRNDTGTEIFVKSHDGTLEQLVGELHPKIRSLLMHAYSELAAPTETASASFLASRRIRA